MHMQQERGRRASSEADDQHWQLRRVASHGLVCRPDDPANQQPAEHCVLRHVRVGAEVRRLRARAASYRTALSNDFPPTAKVDPAAPLTVGNGEFAFTADVTGLQTLNATYVSAPPLQTMSHWCYPVLWTGDTKGGFRPICHAIIRNMSTSEIDHDARARLYYYCCCQYMCVARIARPFWGGAAAATTREVECKRSLNRAVASSNGAQVGISERSCIHDGLHVPSHVT